MSYEEKCKDIKDIINNKSTCDGSCAETRKLIQQLQDMCEKFMLADRKLSVIQSILNEDKRSKMNIDDVVITQDQARFTKMLAISYKNKLDGCTGDKMQSIGTIQMAEDLILSIRKQLVPRPVRQEE